MNSDNSAGTPASAFKLEGCALAVMHGHPTVSFYNAADDVLVNICPTPVLGLNNEPYTIYYQGQVIGPAARLETQLQCQNYIDSAVPQLSVVFVHEACGLKPEEPVPMFITGAPVVALTPQTSVCDFVLYVALKPENYLTLVQHLSLQAEAVHAMLEKFGTSTAGVLQSTTH